MSKRDKKKRARKAKAKATAVGRAPVTAKRKLGKAKAMAKVKAKGKRVHQPQPRPGADGDPRDLSHDGIEDGTAQDLNADELPGDVNVDEPSDDDEPASTKRDAQGMTEDDHLRYARISRKHGL